MSPSPHYEKYDKASGEIWQLVQEYKEIYGYFSIYKEFKKVLDEPGNLTNILNGS